jgi:hypothetical protein
LHPEFKAIIKSIWDKPCRARSALDKIQQKLKLCIQFLKGWDWNKKGEKKKKMLMQQTLLSFGRIEEYMDMDATQLEHKAYLLSEHMSMLEEDEIYWRQRSHESWLLKGDGNNEFFHRMANGRKIQNNIVFFEDNGLRIEGDDKLVDHATNYYTELFGPTMGNMFHIEDDI